MQTPRTNSPPAIRRLVAADQGAVLQLSSDLVSDDLPCSFWGLTANGFRTWLSDSSRLVLVSGADDEATGIACYVRGGPYQEHLAEVSIAVSPASRRSGTAPALLTALEDAGRKAGVRLFKALIQVENTPSRRFFERCGYEHRATLYSEFMSEQFGEIDDCVYYRRLLLD